MTKNKFISGTIILIIGGLITKLLGMITKIITTRYIGDEGIGLYMLVIPTFILFINIAQLGFPIAISKLVAEEKQSHKKILFSATFISLFLNIFLITISLLLSPVVSKLLHDERTLYPLMAIGLVLPLISISSIARGYFFGKHKMTAHITSHIFEQVIRLILIILITPHLLKISLEATATGLVLINIVSELTSIIILLFFLPKKVTIKKKDIKPDKGVIRDILNIGIPTTGSKLVGSISYFLEPIIFTFVLLKVGYSNKFIISEYGVLNGYVQPLLMIPSFFMHAISSSLLPLISKNYANNNLNYVKTKIKQAELMSLTIGLLATFVIMAYPELILKTVYNTTKGIEYLKVSAPFFVFYYLQIPLTTALQAMNKSKEAMMSTIVGAVIKIGLLSILSAFKIGIYGLIIATITNILIVTIYNYIKVRRILK